MHLVHSHSPSLVQTHQSLLPHLSPYPRSSVPTCLLNISPCYPNYTAAFTLLQSPSSYYRSSSLLSVPFTPIMPNFVNFVLRGFQTLFAAVILGLSVSLVKGQWEGTKPPITLQYAAFVGGITLVAAVVGLASEWVTALQGKIGFIIDGVMTVVNLAGEVVSSLPSLSGSSLTLRGSSLGL